MARRSISLLAIPTQDGYVFVKEPTREEVLESQVAQLREALAIVRTFLDLSSDEIRFSAAGMSLESVVRHALDTTRPH